MVDHRLGHGNLVPLLCWKTAVPTTLAECSIADPQWLGRALVVQLIRLENERKISSFS